MITKEDVLKTIADAWWERSRRSWNSSTITYHGGCADFHTGTYLFRRTFSSLVRQRHRQLPGSGPRSYMIGNIYVEEVDDPTIHDTHHGSMVTFGKGWA